MPLYDFDCERCHVTSEQLVSPYERDRPLTCECGGPMRRVQVAPVVTHVARTQGAIMSDGRKVKGLFGKEAPRKRRGRVF